ncbi:MAG: hypothetical protein PHQ12_14750, partial [Chthoniobacteraceae bacterium]|nr:hypothetical protein [Chthoniobacteraceae bacterium]
RPWGLVAPDRTPRGMYAAWQEEFSPAVVTVQRVKPGQVEVCVTARKDFPSYTLRNYRLKAGAQVFDLPVLAPGESKKFTLKPGEGGQTVELQKPGGFVILKSHY